MEWFNLKTVEQQCIYTRNVLCTASTAQAHDQTTSLSLTTHSSHFVPITHRGRSPVSWGLLLLLCIMFIQVRNIDAGFPVKHALPEL